MFCKKLVLEYIDGAEWIVRGGISFQCADGTLIEVPDGFQTDLASIPQSVWTLCPPQGTPKNPIGRAAAVHDWLYSRQEMSFERANEIFHEMLIEDSCADHELIYLGVKFGAHNAWNADQVKYGLPLKPISQFEGDFIGFSQLVK